MFHAVSVPHRFEYSFVILVCMIGACFLVNAFEQAVRGFISSSKATSPSRSTSGDIEMSGYKRA
jgi:hypothetical protein